MSKLEQRFNDLSSTLAGWRKSGSGYVSRCPAHNDKEPSLSISKGKEGRILFNCHAGCQTVDILNAIGWTWDDILPDKERPKGPAQIVKEYTYTDENGRMLYQVCRFDSGAPAKFKPRHKSANNRWKWGLGPEGATIYRLPEVVAAKTKKDPILIVEGEKDVESVLSIGINCATCNPGGAKGWRDHFATYFQNADVFVSGDNDTAGRSFVASVVRNLRPVARSVRIVRLPFTKKGEDISDWISTGGTKEALLDYMRGSKKITKTDVADLSILTKKAFQMRQAGKEEPDILAALDTLNFKQLVPAPMEEVKQIASKAVTQEKGESPLPRKSELTIARHILETMGPDIVFDEAMFWKYSHENEGIWSELDTSEIAKAINDLEGRLYVSGSTDGVEEYKTLTINASTTRGAVHLAQYEASNPNFFNEAPPVVVLTNGALIVERDSVDVSFIDHDKEHRQRASLPFEYDELAICPRWDAFLSEVLPDNEEHGDKQCKLALQQFCGVSLFGLATHYQSCLMLFGSGSNGKSVAMDVISSLFPEGSVASVSPQSFDDDYHAAHLSGKLVNICAETPSVEISRTDRFKAVVSGDPIVARLPYRQPFTMRPRCGHIFAANELFSTRDSTPGFWRRFLPIPWTVTIAQSKRDPNLARKIIETEMPGVFKWALDGLRHVLKNKGYTIPTASEQLKSEWLGESDSVSAFSTDIIIQDDKGKWKFDPIGIKASLLYERYLAWCQSYHHRPVSVTKFGRRMTSLGIEKQREGSGKFYRVDADTKWSSTYEVSPSGADDKTWHN